MLKTFKKEVVCYPGGFYEEITAVFSMKKSSNCDRKLQKFRGLPIYRFHITFVKFLSDFVDQNVENVQK